MIDLSLEKPKRQRVRDKVSPEVAVRSIESDGRRVAKGVPANGHSALAMMNSINISGT